MKNKNNKEDFIQIRDLIQKEKQAALPMFQKDALRSRLNARIEAESKRKHFIPHWLRKPIPALGISFLLVAVAIIVVLKISVKSPYEKNVKVIEQFLQQSPGLQNVIKDEVMILEMSNAYAELEWQIKWVLYSVYRKEISRRELTALFQKVLSRFSTEKGEKTVPSVGRNTGPLKLDEENEIPRKDENFHLLFEQILKKLMEV